MDEIMPVVVPAWMDPRSLWITNLREDRHTDQLFWTENEEDGEFLVCLSEVQARYLREKITEHLNRLEGKN